MEKVKKAGPAPKAGTDIAEPEELETFTTSKREDGFFLRKTEWNYADGGRRTDIKREGIYVELNRGVEFKPIAFLKAVKAYGWTPSEVMKLKDELLKALHARVADRSSKVHMWKDRVRPEAQIRLEEINADLRATLEVQGEKMADLLQIIAQAAEKDPALAELRRKVMGEEAAPAA